MSKPIKRVLLISIGFISILLLWLTLWNQDFFQTNYHLLTADEELLFKQTSDTTEPETTYQHYFSSEKFKFPRHQISQIKVCQNSFLLGPFTTKTLKKKINNEFVTFFNDTANFTWSETTWDIDESEYIFRFYDEKGDVVGKIYFCNSGCYMTKSIPFSPNMKFGMLSLSGFNKLNTYINNQSIWQ